MRFSLVMRKVLSWSYSWGELIRGEIRLLTKPNIDDQSINQVILLGGAHQREIRLLTKPNIDNQSIN